MSNFLLEFVIGSISYNIHELCSLPIWLANKVVRHGACKGVKCWNSNSMGARRYVKERLELTPMGPFDVEQGGVNSGPDSCRVPGWMQTDGPGFSLCAAPLELSGPGF